MKRIALLIITISLTLAGCAGNPMEVGEPKNLKSLFTLDTNNPSEVYIEEEGVLVPYILIEEKYKGKILLLRKHLLDKQIQYNKGTSFGSKSGYYPEGNIDKYLNTEYLQKLPLSLQDKILETSISISTLETVDSGGGTNKTEKIKRKIFILSATELNIRSSMAAKEDRRLKYYKESVDLVATNQKGDADAYWLRTAYLWDDHQAWCVGADGEVGGSLVEFEYTLRPTFCLDPNIRIKRQKGVYKLDI